MKLKYLIIPIIFLAVSCQNTTKETTTETESATEEIKPEVTANAKKVEINIEGMTCTGCENAIQNTINEFDGVYTSKADHMKGIAVLEFDSSKVDIAAVKDSINELGYEAKDHHFLTE